MLKFIRKMAKTWVVKILFFGLLIVSFGLWGVSDYLNKNVNGNDSVASLDGEDISLAQFAKFYEGQKNSLNLGNIDAKTAQSMGLADILMNKFITQSVISKRIDEWQLHPDTKILAQIIKEDKAFSDSEGKFSPSKFQQILQQNNITEAQLLDSVAKQVGQSWLIESAVPNKLDLPNLTKYLTISRLATKNIDYFVINTKDIAHPKAPQGEEIKKWFSDHQEQYRQPQFRSGNMIQLSIEDLMAKTSLSDEEIKVYYESHKDQFQNPRLISIEQLLFSEETDANKAYDLVKKNTDFAKIPSTLPNAKYTKIDNVNQEQAQFAGLSEEFNLNKGEISKPKKTDFGFVMVKPFAVQAAGVIAFDNAKAKIAQGIKADKAISQLNDLSKSLNDMAAGGANIQEFAKKTGAKIQPIALSDRTGSDKNGKKIDGFNDEIFDQLFQLTSGKAAVVENDKGIAVVAVQEIIESTIPKFEEIAVKVNADWINAQDQETLNKLAMDYVDEINKGKPISQIAQTAKVKLESIKNINYQDVLANKVKIADQSAKFLFNDPQKAQFLVVNNSVIIAQLSKANQQIADLTKTDLAQNIIRQSMTGEYQNGFLESLKSHFKVKIFNEALAKLY